MRYIVQFFKKEPVLGIAVILAIGSACIITPDKGYIGYIDFRTLAILFCLMAIVAGLREQGLFDRMAEKLLHTVSGTMGISCVLVFLCFFSSMFITNDVALITFVPFTIVIVRKMQNIPEPDRMLSIVVMQTIAANLGSMLTPIGNPQNLYLYGRTQMRMLQFVRLMLPYTVAAAILLWIWIAVANKKYGTCSQVIPPERNASVGFPMNGNKMIVYGILFGLSLLTVARVLQYFVLFIIVFLYMLCFDRKLFKRVDYSLLATFFALFIFIGNIGRIPVFCTFLENLLQGREVVTAVFASQVMSNVPAAILLSGFTKDTQALILGTNLGGLGTLIASMASLISFKYIAKENEAWRGRYFKLFTVANLVFLIALLGMFGLTLIRNRSII